MGQLQSAFAVQCTAGFADKARTVFTRLWLKVRQRLAAMDDQTVRRVVWRDRDRDMIARNHFDVKAT